MPLPLDTISERSETSSRKPSPVPTEVRNSSERSDAISITIAHGEALDLGASTLVSAEQSSHAVNSDTGNGDAGEFPGTSSSTGTSQVEGEPQTPGLASHPGNNGRTNGDTKDATDGKPRVGRRREAEEMLAKVKARLKTKLKKYFRSIKGHCYCDIKRIVEELVHI